MRAITVRQPHAWAIIHGGKDVENRSRNIAGSYRGPVAIHAGLAKFEQGGMSSEAHRRAHGSEVGTEIVFGALIGVVDLVEVHDGNECNAGWLCSLWAMHDHQHLVLSNPRPLAKPISYKGALGLWTLPDGVIPEASR